MGQIIKKFSDGSFLEYDRGSFDDWCVYLTKPDGKRKPPRDMDYFNQLKVLSEDYGVEKVYCDYVEVYNITGKEVRTSDLNLIAEIAKTYAPGDVLLVDTILSILYMAMIAEERKRNTRLGKRIKRLGIYKLLLENSSVADAANFMRGMGWRDIDALCRERGF